MATLESVRRDALLLSTEDREFLAVYLALSIETEPGYDDAWAAELQRRMQAIDSGEDVPVPWNEAEGLIFGPDD